MGLSYDRLVKLAAKFRAEAQSEEFAASRKEHSLNDAKMKRTIAKHRAKAVKLHRRANDAEKGASRALRGR